MSSGEMGRLPTHIAFIMDGNGRWAQQRRLPRLTGHQIGSENAVRIIKYCSGRGIKVLTLFAFSVENWNRPQSEVAGLLKLFYTSFDKEMHQMRKLNIRIRVIGDLHRLNAALYAKIKEVEHLTEDKTGLMLIVAVGYGGQWDIVQATKSLAQKVSQGVMRVEEITPERFSQQLQLSDLPSPDLCIRTGGEYRISNFLLWHLAYSELYFTSILWPDFNELALDEALTAYACRDRRFGVLHETTP
jgi:undecaprenyl diphosphate synthase